MNSIKEIKEKIELNLSTINEINIENKLLQDKLNQLELSNWEPDEGDYVVEPSGKIFDKKQWPSYAGDILEGETKFGSVRTTVKRAEMAANNMKRFNRLSCFMGDSKPLLEYSPISVALVFYDYEEERLSKLKKILDLKGEL